MPNLVISPLLLASTLFILSGCAYVPPLPYSAPASGPVARLRVVVPEVGHFVNVLVAGADKDSYCQQDMELGRLGGQFGINFSDLTPIGMPGADALKPKTFLERVIPAGKPYTLRVSYHVHRSACHPAVDFTPADNTDYQASILLTGKYCEIFLTKLTKNSDGQVDAVREPTERRGFCQR